MPVGKELAVTGEAFQRFGFPRCGVAGDAFLARNPDFVLEEPAFPFNEGMVRNRVTYWPNSFLKRR